MSRRSFRSQAAELFGLDPAEARDLLTALKGDGYVTKEDSLFDEQWGSYAADLLDEFLSEPEDVDDPSMFDYNFEWGPDEWIDADTEYEITVTYEEVI